MNHLGIFFILYLFFLSTTADSAHGPRGHGRQTVQSSGDVSHPDRKLPSPESLSHSLSLNETVPWIPCWLVSSYWWYNFSQACKKQNPAARGRRSAVTEIRRDIMWNRGLDTFTCVLWALSSTIPQHQNKHRARLCTIESHHAFQKGIPSVFCSRKDGFVLLETSSTRPLCINL